MPESVFEVGFSEVDITPPVGLAMSGSLDPRQNMGVSDPLLAKTMVATYGGRAVVVVGVDLVYLPRAVADQAIAEAAATTDIEPDAMMISCSHTHSGPYTTDRAPLYGLADPEYLSSLPSLISSGIAKARKTCQPATMKVGRSLVYHGLHYRRVLCKDGKAVNTWMRGLLNDLDRCPQVVGSAGPIDPEMWVLRFDDVEGDPLGVLVNFTCHVNSRGGTLYSADYPAVIAEGMRETLGRDVVSVFTPGACANVNPTRGGAMWREGAEWFAEQAVEAAKRARRVEEPIPVDVVRRDVAVPRRDPSTQAPEAIGRLDWGGRGGREDSFAPRLDWVAGMPEQLSIPVSAARIGPVGIATNAGELFVEWGLSMKSRSPFPHTIVCELTNDSIMYQPTHEAFEQQGYEALVGANLVSPEGIETLVDSAVELLEELWAR